MLARSLHANEQHAVVAESHRGEVGRLLGRRGDVVLDIGSAFDREELGSRRGPPEEHQRATDCLHITCTTFSRDRQTSVCKGTVAVSQGNSTRRQIHRSGLISRFYRALWIQTRTKMNTSVTPLLKGPKFNKKKEAPANNRTATSW